MHLVCNILNAVGGAPVINAADFIPWYPGPLPMGIGGADGLVKRYSKATVQNTFMEIEEPENPIHIPVEPSIAAAPESIPSANSTPASAPASPVMRNCSPGTPSCR